MAQPRVPAGRPGSPAAKAGLGEGDQIVAVNDVPVDRIAAVRHQLAVRYAGDTVALTLQRGAGDDLTSRRVEVTLVAAEAAEV